MTYQGDRLFVGGWTQRAVYSEVLWVAMNTNVNRGEQTKRTRTTRPFALFLISTRRAFPSFSFLSLRKPMSPYQFRSTSIAIPTLTDAELCPTGFLLSVSLAHSEGLELDDMCRDLVLLSFTFLVVGVRT